MGFSGSFLLLPLFCSFRFFRIFLNSNIPISRVAMLTAETIVRSNSIVVLETGAPLRNNEVKDVYDVVLVEVCLTIPIGLFRARPEC